MLVHIIVTQSCSDNKKEFISIEFYEFSYPNAAKSVAATLARTETYSSMYSTQFLALSQTLGALR